MSFRNTSDRYGSIAITFHWLTALLIFTAFYLGVTATDYPKETQSDLTLKVIYFSLHKTVGIFALLIAVLRIGWALVSRHPNPAAPAPWHEAFLAALTHWALYGAMLVMPISGWVHHAASPVAAPILIPSFEGISIIPVSTTIAEISGQVHNLSKWVFIGAVSLHIIGALKHAIINRDATLARMLPGNTRADVGPRNRMVLPALIAVTIWATVLTAGALTFSAQPQAAPSAHSAQDSEWKVTQGQINLTIKQFGNEISGSFQDWSADIRFDPNIPAGKAGRATITIDVTSLSLAALHDQAMGPDFFDSARFTTAITELDLTRVPDGLEASGSLTLKGITVPVRFFAYLDMAAPNMATAKADFSLDRTAFGIGANVTDQSTLANDVAISVEIQATKP